METSVTITSKFQVSIPVSIRKYLGMTKHGKAVMRARLVAQVKKFFEAVSRGEVTLYLSSVVLLEMAFVLKSVYKKDADLIMKAIKKTVKVRGGVIVDKMNLKLALEYLDKYKVKFSDCLIASSIPKEVKVFSYDVDFKKMKLDLFDIRDL